MPTERIEIEIASSVSGEEQVKKIAGSLGSLEASGTSASKGLTDAGQAADKASKGFTDAGKSADSSSIGFDKMGLSALKINNITQLVGDMVSVLGGVPADVLKTADAYNNLAARVKLVTGEGGAFNTAFAGIIDIAIKTGSTLESTGTLFSKIAEAGKAMGVGQADALKLTETINKAIQLSGASAQASDAAIIQLVQGIQSGVLRGDEFNSVMEQSPRLAKAMADGLGVTTGELRKMAGEGQLTSETVIKALQGQSDAVTAEFDKLPPTVGRALTNLSTSWTLYVGETDKATGASKAVASAIDALAGNLSTVATVMIHTGEVLGAMKLLSMAQDWLGVNAAITANAAATTASTAKTVGDTVAKEANTVAALANAAAVTKSAVAYDSMGLPISQLAPSLADLGKKSIESTKSLGEGAISAGNLGGALGKVEAPVSAASKALGVMGGAVSSLATVFKPLILLDIALNFKQYGTAIGEAAAKLMGYKDRTNEIAEAEKTSAKIIQDGIDARKRMATAIQEATDKQYDLSKAGKASITEFETLTKKGDTAAEAIAKIGKDFDLSTVPGIKNAASVLDKLQADGKISATEFQKAWSDALKGQDLEAFKVKAEIALDGTSRKTEELAQILDATLREAIKRSGLDFDLISGGMGKASVSAINDTQAMIDGLDRLKAMGVDTAQALTASIGKSIETAESQKALDAVRLQIEEVRKTLGDKVADGLLDQATKKANGLTDALDKVKPGIDSVREAMITLGLKTREELDSSAQKATSAYGVIKDSGQAEGESYVAWQARKTAAAEEYIKRLIAANGGVADGSIKAKAAMEGLSVASDAAGKSIISSMTPATSAQAALTKEISLGTVEYEKEISAATHLREITSEPGSKASKDTEAAYRTKALEGQNAVDNNLMFDVRDKFNAGKLTEADIEDVNNVLAALKQNAANNAFGRSMGAISDAGIKDDQDWQNTAAVLQNWVNDQKNKSKGKNIPKLASGTNYVPYDDFPAILHKGEAVVPAEYNPSARNTQRESSNGELQSYLDKLNALISEQTANANAIADAREAPQKAAEAQTKLIADMMAAQAKASADAKEAPQKAAEAQTKLIADIMATQSKASADAREAPEKAREAQTKLIADMMASQAKASAEAKEDPQKAAEAQTKLIADMVAAQAKASAEAKEAPQKAAEAQTKLLADIQAAQYALLSVMSVGSISGSGKKIPKLANGTNYVPEDEFLALLHRGEAVVPAEYNPSAGGQSDGTSFQNINTILSNYQQAFGKMIMAGTSSSDVLELRNKLEEYQNQLKSYNRLYWKP